MLLFRVVGDVFVLYRITVRRQRRCLQAGVDPFSWYNDNDLFFFCGCSPKAPADDRSARRICDVAINVCCTGPADLRKRYCRVLKAAGIRQKGQHSLRHTFAANLVNGQKQPDGTMRGAAGPAGG